MMTVNDSVMKALYDLGYRGSYNDRVLSHMKDELGVTNINGGYYKAGGFGKYVEGLLSPVVSYVARLDGVSQYMQLSETINYSVGDVIYISCSQPNAAFNTLVGGDMTTLLIRRSNNGSIIFGGCSIVVNGSPAISGSTQWPDGVSEFEITLTVNIGVSRLGVRGDVLTGYFTGFLKNFSDSLGHNIPLTNKGQGAVQLAVSGGVNATFANYTEAMWEEVL